MEYLDETDALIIIGEGLAAGADVAGGLEQPVVSQPDKASGDAQVNLALLVWFCTWLWTKTSYRA